MKKRTIAVLLAFLCGFGGAISAQDFTPVTNDLSSMLGAIGDSIVPYVQQTVLADDGIGAASLGKSRFFIGGSLGATFAPGLLGQMSDQSRYQVLDVTGLLNTMVGQIAGSSAASGYIDTLKTFFPDPDTKIALGFRTVDGIEVLGTFSILPQFLTNFGTGLANISGVTLNALSAGVRVRKTLLEDSGAYPAISIGVGYTYASFNAAYTLGSSIAPIGSGSYSIDLSGAKISLGNTLNTAGVDLAISKKLLIFTPYLRFMPWYSWSTFDSSFGPFNISIGGTPKAITASSPFSSQTLSLLLAGGVEIHLGAVALVPAGSYSILNNTWSANLSTRLQF